MVTRSGGRRSEGAVGRRLGVAIATVAAGLVVVAVPAATPVFAASITVTTTADGIDAAASCPAVTLASLPGPGGQTTLREAVCAANSNSGADTITFSTNGTFTLAGAANDDNGTSGDLDVKGSLQVTGNGVTNTIISGGGIERVFDVFPASASTFGLSGLTVQGGDTRTTSFREGGAMYLHNNVTATLTSVTVRNNFAGANAAIESRGTLTIASSVVSGNQTIPTAGNANGGGLHSTGTLTVTDSTFSGNSVRGDGGGISINAAASVTVSISRSTFSGNTATAVAGSLGRGGAISTSGNQAAISLTNVTMSGNGADADGGAAFFTSQGVGNGAITLNNVTVTNNTSDTNNAFGGDGGGIFRTTASLTLRNTLVAGNFDTTSAVRDDVSGAVQSASANNLIGDGTGLSGITNGSNANQVGSGASPINPLVAPLADNGGPTQTHALLVGSPAIDTGNNATCAATDQRSVTRSTCDIGAYELADTTPPDTTITSTPPNPSASSSATFTFTGTDTGGSGLAGFQCRLDGGGFSTCTSPRALSGLADGSHTFQVRAVDGSGNVDPTPATYTWVVDTTAPNTTITGQPTNPSASNGASFTFTGTDPGGSGVTSFQCRLDGGPFSACPTPRTYSGLADGAHTFEVRSVDAAGNTDPTPASYTWVVDTTGPDTTITSQPTNPSASTAASFTFTGSDPGGSGVTSFQCQLDGGPFSACSSPRSYSGLADGSHTFQVRAIDGAGNTDPTPASFTWLVDTTGPDTTITAQPTDPSASAGASFTFTGSDPGGSGVASFQCQLDGGGFTACTSPQAYAGLTDGPHTFQVRSIDAAGNVDPTPASVTWTIDATAPDTAITGQPTDPSASAGASFTFTGSDPGGSGVASFQCQLDGGGFTACTSPQAYVGLTDGPHTFVVRAVDLVGNVDPTPASFSWTIDTGAPGTVITSQPTDPSASTAASFTFTGDDGSGTGVASFECQLDGGAFTACTSPQSYAGLTDGSHTFQVRAIDLVGIPDPTPATYTWLVDTVAPDTTITASPTDPSASTGASFSFAGGDGGGSGVASFECQLDGGAFAACSSPQSYAGLTDGLHTFAVRAIDVAGNVDPTPATFGWLVDTTAPDTTITAQPADPSASTGASFGFAGSDPGGTGVASFQCQLDGGGFTACTSPQAYVGLTDGSHTFQVRAIDAAGNVDPTPATFGWLVDTTAPTTVITTPPTDPSASAAASIAFTGADLGGSGVVSFECQLDGGPFATCTSPAALSGLTDGSHTFQVRAVDAAGNVDPTPASVTWVVDTTAPDTTIPAAPASPSASPAATVAFTGTDGSGSGISSFECQLDGGAFAACTSPAALSGLADGSHTFQVRAVDAAGNVDPTPASVTWVIDTTAPDTTITAAPPNPSTGTIVTVAFTGTDGAGGSGVVSFQCQLDGGAFTACSNPATFTGLAAGSHTFQVRAIDRAGNVDPSPSSVTWTVVEVASEAPVSTSTTTTAVASAAGGGGLPATGNSGMQEWLTLGLVLVLGGSLLLLLRLRRRPPDRSRPA